jgi:hypothetical protein
MLRWLMEANLLIAVVFATVKQRYREKVLLLCPECLHACCALSIVSENKTFRAYFQESKEQQAPVQFAAPPALAGPGAMHDTRGSAVGNSLNNLEPSTHSDHHSTIGGQPDSSTCTSVASNFPMTNSLASSALPADGPHDSSRLGPLTTPEGHNAWLETDSESESENPLACNALGDWAGQSSWVNALTDSHALTASAAVSAAVMTEATSGATSSASVWQMTEQDRLRAEAAVGRTTSWSRVGEGHSAETAVRSWSWGLPLAPGSAPGTGRATAHSLGTPTEGSPAASWPGTGKELPPSLHPHRAEGIRVLHRKQHCPEEAGHPGPPLLCLPSLERVKQVLSETGEVCAHIQDLFDQLQGHAIMAMQNTATAAQAAAAAAKAVSPPPLRLPPQCSPLPPLSPPTAAFQRLGITDSSHLSPHTPDSHFGSTWLGSSPLPSSPVSPHITLAHYGSAPPCGTRHHLSPHARMDYRSNATSPLACSAPSAMHSLLLRAVDEAGIGLRGTPRASPHDRPPLHPHVGPLLSGRGSNAASPASAPFPPRRSIFDLPPRPPPLVLPECRFCRVQSPNTMSLVAHVLSKGAPPVPANFLVECTCATCASCRCTVCMPVCHQMRVLCP